MKILIEKRYAMLASDAKTKGEKIREEKFLAQKIHSESRVIKLGRGDDGNGRKKLSTRTNRSQKISSSSTPCPVVRAAIVAYP